MAKSRLENVVRNSGATIVNRSGQILIRFVIRTLFIRVLGNEYTGISSLFTDILSVLSLVEMGLDASMIFSLYKPLAKKDVHHVAALINFYRFAFTAIGIIVFLLGMGCVPFLHHIVKDVPNIKEDIRFIFIMYVVTSASSYFFIYKSVLIRADQRSSVISNVTTVVDLLECLAEVILILLFKRFFIYLVLHFAAVISRNLCLSYKAEKLYPEYLNNKTAKLSETDKASLIKNILALIVYNLAAVILNSTDSIFISAFVGTVQVAIVGNFTLITNSVKSCIKMVVDATRPSVGNLVATGTVDLQNVFFKRINLITFWIACFCSNCLFVLLNPFIADIWFDESYKVSMTIVALIVVNFYISVMSYAIGTFRSSNGLFIQGWYRPAVMAILNIVLDFYLGRAWGIVGIYAATAIALLTTQVWYDPYIVYKYAFKRKPWGYYLDYVGKACIMLVCCTVSYLLIQCIDIPNKFMSFVVSVLIAVTIPNATIVACFWRTDEFKYAMSIVIKIIGNFFRKRHA